MPYAKKPSNSIRLDTRLESRLADKKKWLDSFRPLRPNVAKRLQEDLRIRLTYHSNAIEGNTLTLRETQLVVEEGLTIGGHTLKEHLEATNHAGAYDYVTQLADQHEKITRQTILDLHKLVMAGIDETAGSFRQVQVYIRGANVTPPPAREIERMLAEWLEWLQGPGMNYPAIVRAVISHHDFEVIHPFVDGNGRTGRLILNLMLMREGYPPALVLREWRGRYLRALDTATTGGGYSPIANLIGQAVEEGLDLYLGACEAYPEEEYEALASLAQKSGFSADYLGWLVRQGRLEAVKRGGRWFSTNAAIKKYQAEVANKLVRAGRPPNPSPEN